MVGSQYQADVPACICHYKDGEKGNPSCWTIDWQYSKYNLNPILSNPFLPTCMFQVKNRILGTD